MTRGQVMTYDNRYVRGWFHAYSGGITARAKEDWITRKKSRLSPRACACRKTSTPRKR